MCSLEGKNVLITETASVPGEEDRFLEPRSAVTFAFDHMRVVRPSPCIPYAIAHRLYDV